MTNFIFNPALWVTSVSIALTLALVIYQKSQERKNLSAQYFSGLKDAIQRKERLG